VRELGRTLERERQLIRNQLIEASDAASSPERSVDAGRDREAGTPGQRQPAGGLCGMQAGTADHGQLT
jgi:hypothetical protein